MAKRDRHGRLRPRGRRRGLMPETVQDIHDLLHAAHYAALDEIARAVFGDRNAQGYPVHVRAEVKTRARPHFREALKHARNAHKALRGNDLHEYEAERLRAELEMRGAEVQFRQAYLDHHRSVQTGKAAKGAAVRWADRGEVNNIITTLAMRTDPAMGEPLPAADLWPEFYNALETAEFNPRDTSGAHIQDTDRMFWNGNAQGMTFKTFRNKISDACP